MRFWVWISQPDLLKRLETENLFVARRNDWYRYHHLFREFASRLLHHDPRGLGIFAYAPRDGLRHTGRCVKPFVAHYNAIGDRAAARLMSAIAFGLETSSRR